MQRQYFWIDFAVGGDKGLAALVELAVDRPDIGAPQCGLDRLFDKGTRFFDDDELFASAGEGADDFAIERIDHRQLQNRHAQAQVIQRLSHIGIALAGSDDSHRPPGVGVDDAIEVIGADIGFDQGPLFLYQLPLHRQGARGHDDLIKALVEIALWQGDLGTHAIEIDRARPIANRRDHFQRRRDPSMPRQGDGVQTEADDVFDIGRIENRHHAAAQDPIAGPGRHRTLGAMVLARQKYDRPPLPGTAQIGQPHFIGYPHRAVGLAIPEGVDITALGKLAAENGGSRGFLVDAKLVHRPPHLVEQGHLLDQLEIQPPQGRALIASKIGLIYRTRGLVVALFFEYQAHDCLHTRQKYPPFQAVEFIPETDIHI